MYISHVGQIKPLPNYAALAESVQTSLAPINHALGNSTPAPVSIRLSQSVLTDPDFSADHLNQLLEQQQLNLIGMSGVSISGGRKHQVHHPDWRTEERLGFMFPAINIAAEFAITGRDFGITTNALSHRHWVDNTMPGNWAALTLNVIRAVQHMVALRDRTGLTVHMDIEAEPGSLLRDTSDILRFYTEWLLPRGAAMLSDRMLISDGTARESVLRHVRLALDTAHAAVVWDDPQASMAAFQEHGIRIGRIQASSALEVEVPTTSSAQTELVEHLQALASPKLLQQLVATRNREIVRRFDDLPAAIAAIGECAGDTWRMHIHSPLLADRYGVFSTTRQETAEWIREAIVGDDRPDLIELRSANWELIPHDDRESVEQMISREADWVRSIIASATGDSVST